MTKDIVTVDRSESLAKATLLMEEHRIRHLAVTDKREIIGVLTAKDLEKYYSQLHDRE